MSTDQQPGPNGVPGFWIDKPEHIAFLREDASKQFSFYFNSLGDRPGFYTLDKNGAHMPGGLQELHTTTRLVHSYALASLCGVDGADKVVDQGMAYLQEHHLDSVNGGYHWGIDDGAIADQRKLAYGHVFVLLAGASALMAGHPDAERLIENVTDVLSTRYWEDDHGVFADEFNSDWSPFSTYRGMNANMHGVEALLAAFEATDDTEYLTRAGRILDFFVGRMAPQHGWRLPEHYTEDWEVDAHYSGNPMFRPAGTTPGHSFELGRLALQYWDLNGRPDDGMPERARRLIEQALADAWLEDGGLAYTLNFDGSVAIGDRYWWPVTEAIGAMATLIKLDRKEEDERWYRTLWTFASNHFIDHEKGGWFPEIAADGSPTSTQFYGKPDIYHAVQACLFPTVPEVSRLAKALKT